MANDIDNIIVDARLYAAQILSGAGAAMEAAMQALANLAVQQLNDDITQLLTIDPPKPPDGYTPAGYGGSTYTPLDLTTIGQIPKPGPVGPLVAPPDPGKPPGVAPYHAPDKPTVLPANPSLIANPPNIDIDAVVEQIPEPPELQSKIAAIPVPPVSDIVIPPPPVYNIPGYNPGTITDPGPPPDLDGLLRAQYDEISPVMRNVLRAEFDSWVDYYFPTLRQGIAAMEAKLDRFLEGGTGLTAEVEDAIYNRALDKEHAEGGRALDKVYSEAAKLGFTALPPFALQQAKEVDRAMRDNLARSANEIMVKNAELEQQNIQFALTLRNNAADMHVRAGLTYHSQLVQINGQAVQYAIAAVEQVVKMYNLAVDYARVQVALEEARIHMYEAQLKAAMAVLDFYKAQLEGELAKVTIDKARVDLYTAQLHAIEVQASIYNTEMQGARLRGDIEKLKVELYDANVKAYAAQVSAYAAGWQGYEAAVRGAMADVTASVEQIRGYSAASENWRALLGGRIAELDAKQRLNDGNVKVYEAQVQALRAINSASAESVKAEHETYDLETRTSLAAQQAQSDFYRSQVSYYDVTRRALVETVQIELENLRVVSALANAKASAIAQISAAIGHDYAATSQAALSGLNTLAGKVETTTIAAPAA